MNEPGRIVWEDNERDAGEAGTWWAGWDLSEDAPSCRKPTRKLVLWALERWGDPPAYAAPYVEALRQGRDPRGAGPPSLPNLEKVFTRTAWAWVVVTLTDRDGLSLRQALARTAELFGVSYGAVKAYWQGEGRREALPRSLRRGREKLPQSYRRGKACLRDSDFVKWVRDNRQWAPVPPSGQTRPTPSR